MSPFDVSAESTEAGPLDGVRVLDLTASWAGPMAGRMLAALGAQVIHVEGPERMDAWRGERTGGDRSLYPGGEPGAHPFNRSSMFNSQNLGKLSLVIDAKDADGLGALRRLATGCDVIITNFRSGALDRMGIGYNRMRELNPGIIVVEMPAFGSTGPMARHGALGPTMELVAGMAALVGYGDGEPIATGPAYMDPIGAYNATSATVTALLERQAVGTGQHVEVAQTEAGMNWIGEQFLYSDHTGRFEQPDGNHVPWASPHNCYQCAGDDEWVVIAVTDDAQWAALCRIAGLEQAIDDERFATVAARHANEDELDELLGEWIAAQSKFDVAERLQEAGVAAAPVLNGKDITESGYLESRGFFLQLDHAEAGPHRYQGLPFHLSRSSTKPSTASPLFGQHSRYVLTELVGLSNGDVDDLVRRGVVFDSAS